MKEIYFDNGMNNPQFIAIVENDQDPYPTIRQDIMKRNPSYVVPYIRTWKDKEDTLWFDVGSYLEFYFVREKNDE